MLWQTVPILQYYLTEKCTTDIDSTLNCSTNNFMVGHLIVWWLGANWKKSLQSTSSMRSIFLKASIKSRAAFFPWGLLVSTLPVLPHGSCFASCPWHFACGSLSYTQTIDIIFILIFCTSRTWSTKRKYNNYTKKHTKITNLVPS